MQKYFFAFHFTVLIASVLIVETKGEGCTATVRNGTIFGDVVGTLNPDKNVCAFLGIPYASPPVGPLRFKASQPPQSWASEGLNATSIPNWCPQAGSAPPGVKITEDCLYLNVYTPQINSTTAEGFSVMIWFHGGGFTSGSSHLYSPIRLLAGGDIILVAVHYRLGLLGFLSTGDKVSPGNYGLKDQAHSIRWVNENIRAFGGDPSKITIFGESAGGASTIYQLISPLNKGLLNGVIAQSGTALAIWALDRNPSESARLMARRLGCSVDSSEEILNCLRETKWENIIAEQTKFTNECYQNMSYAYSTMTPVVEPDLPGAFISKEPMEIMKYGDVPNVPVLLGGNKHDGSFILATLYLAKFGSQKLDKNPEYMKEQIVPDVLRFFSVGDGDSANRADAASVELAYLPGVNRSSWNESMPGLVDPCRFYFLLQLMSVFAFKSSIQSTANILAKRNSSVYLYSFEHHSQNTLWRLHYSRELPVQPGIAHGDELMYLFNLPATKFSPQDQSFSEIIADLWLNFGTLGNPTPDVSDQCEQWPKYNRLDEPFMKLNITPKVMYGYRNSWRPNGFEWN